MRWDQILKFAPLAATILLSCNSPQTEKVPDSKPLSTEIYSKQLSELEEPEGMLEKEKFFAKKAFLEEQSGLITDAIGSLEKAIRLNPNVGLYHFRLARLYEQMDLLMEARSSAERAVNLGTNTEGLLLFIAELYLQEGNFKKGIEFLDERFGGLPESPELLSIRGRLLLNRGDSSRAISDLQRSSEYGNRIARKILASYYLDTSPNETIRLIGNDFVGDDNQTWILIRAYYNLGKVDTLPNLVELLREPATEQILSLARMYYEADYYSQAREQYNMLIERDTAHQAAIKELEELERNIAYLQKKRTAAKADTSTQLVQRDSVTNND